MRRVFWAMAWALMAGEVILLGCYAYKVYNTDYQLKPVKVRTK